MTDIPFIPYKEFHRVIDSTTDKFEKLQVISDMCRVNTLSAIKGPGQDISAAV